MGGPGDRAGDGPSISYPTKVTLIIRSRGDCPDRVGEDTALEATVRAPLTAVVPSRIFSTAVLSMTVMLSLGERTDRLPGKVVGERDTIRPDRGQQNVPSGPRNSTMPPRWGS
jgi:hypothetical protein